MLTRKLPSKSEENVNKRRRCGDNDGNVRRFRIVYFASFDSLNTDCKVHIFSFLPVKDLNTVALCSKGCCEARNNESLDQARTGTIILTKNCTARSVRNAVVAAEQKNIFSGNCTSLKIDGVDQLGLQGYALDLPRLTGVTKLQISQFSEDRNLVTRDCLGAMIRMCPNANDIDLSGVNILRPEELFDGIRLQRIQQLAWKGCTFMYSFTCGFLRDARNLTEVYLDGAVFNTGTTNIDASKEWYGSMEGHPRHYLLGQCANLQKVSVKRATVSYLNDYDNELLPQEFIIKFARLHPTLRWLRSDLSEENVAMLQAERPHITFVSE